jgi:very-short-patch-repair endonuclease
VRPPGGSAYNEIEAKRVVDEVIHLIDQLHNQTFTLGVVTPFSRQEHLINEYLRNRIDPSTWETSKLLAATAHKFQGDERDIMIFSPVVSEGIKAGTLYWLAETPNLFNVAISRARSLLIIVGNLAYCLQSSGLLKQMAEYVHQLSIEAELRRTEAESLLASPAEKRLYQGLLQRGMKVTPKWRAGPYEVDFAYMEGGFRLDIECDRATYHLEAGRQRRQDMVRDVRIRQLGWEVLRLPAWEILDDLSDCLNRIENLVSRK